MSHSPCPALACLASSARSSSCYTLATTYHTHTSPRAIVVWTLDLQFFSLHFLPVFPRFFFCLCFCV
uniref:Putative secreted protein n=1 Tax=Anopheles darlingi TaxID=43151 RepID=A0A2M4DD42_ANODA